MFSPQGGAAACISSEQIFEIEKLSAREYETTVPPVIEDSWSGDQESWLSSIHRLLNRDGNGLHHQIMLSGHAFQADQIQSPTFGDDTWIGLF